MTPQPQAMEGVLELGRDGINQYFPFFEVNKTLLKLHM
jgi:hypothetical protein